MGFIFQGRIQDFKLGGGLKKNCAERWEARNLFGVFRVKNHDFTPINHIFSNFRGGGGRRVPLWNRPCLFDYFHSFFQLVSYF
jgi:hypothetical protein